MFILAWTRKLYKILSADASPSAIAFAVGFGLTLSLIPLLSGLGLFLIFCVLIFRVQVSTTLLALGLGKLLYALGLYKLMVPVGETLLETEGLRGFWKWFLNLPFIPWLELDRLAVTGGFVLGLALGAILFLPVRMLVISYRTCVHEKVSQNRFFRWLTSFWLTKFLRFIFIGTKTV